MASPEENLAKNSKYNSPVLNNLISNIFGDSAQ